MWAWIISGVLAVYIVISALMIFLAPAEPSQSDLNRQKHAVVVVLGDLGHSPRMNFHALSIAKCGWKVTLVGYLESQLMAEVEENELITVRALEPTTRAGSYIVYAIKRVFTQHYELYKLLASLGTTDVLMVQNPPSIPTLGVARFFTLFNQPGAKLIIDWHNLGYSILAMTVKQRFAVTLYRAYEMIFGHVAYIHLAVSVRLGMALRSNLHVNPKRVVPLYDRPWKSYVIPDAERLSARAQLKLANPTRKLLITSTSYTPDEDLSVLLDALELYEKDPRAGPLNVVVTGKGPLKSWFLGAVESRTFTNVSISTLWLSYEDYHRLLAVADLGISLHRSSSGWDLPMKVVDMFGAGLPVAALDFPALKELVKPENGVTFTNASTLCEQLAKVLSDRLTYAQIKSGALKEAQETWFEQWRVKVGPVFGYGIYTGEESSSSDSD